MSVLSNIGNAIKKFLGVDVKVAVAAEPFIAVAFPGVAPLFNTVVTAVGNAEVAAIAAENQTGTGAQKLALVVASVESSFSAYEKANGIAVPHTQDQITAAVNSVVTFLNILKAPTDVPATPSATVAAITAAPTAGIITS